MSFYAMADGNITAIDKTAFNKIIKIIDRNRENIDASIDIKPDIKTLSIDISIDYDDYEENNTLKLLNDIAPFTKNGKIEYSGEEDSQWMHVFNTDKKAWRETNAITVYEDDLSALSLKSLKEELKKRGYTVTKIKKG